MICGRRPWRKTKEKFQTFNNFVSGKINLKYIYFIFFLKHCIKQGGKHISADPVSTHLKSLNGLPHKHQHISGSKFIIIRKEIHQNWNNIGSNFWELDANCVQRADQQLTVSVDDKAVVL